VLHGAFASFVCVCDAVGDRGRVYGNCHPAARNLCAAVIYTQVDDYTLADDLFDKAAARVSRVYCLLCVLPHY
jgi:hypothetical protein